MSHEKAKIIFKDESGELFNYLKYMHTNFYGRYVPIDAKYIMYVLDLLNKFIDNL